MISSFFVSQFKDLTVFSCISELFGRIIVIRTGNNRTNIVIKQQKQQQKTQILWKLLKMWIKDCCSCAIFLS